ncbi:MAG TPA: amidohydrolase family protein [Gaiellaceae bacterium]|nr:amidohydrolase family protein [Gaiellaceae bacterium]
MILSADWVMPVSAPPIRDGAVAIADGRITAVGTSADLGEGMRFDGAAIVPGFVNAHSHLEYAVYAGFGDGLVFGDWIGVHIERKQRLEFEDVVDISRLGVAECLASGITCVGDCAFHGAAAVACHELGLRGIVYLEVFGSDPETALGRFERLRDLAAAGFSERVRPGVSPHAPYTVTSEVYAACAELGVPVATHISESVAEAEYLSGRGGPWEAFRELLVTPAGTTGTRLLNEIGALGPQLVAAHCVTVEPDEIALLAEHGAGVAHCPRSNALLGCGVAPLRDLLDRGVTVGLGTDSPASTPSFDMFEELRSAIAFARARERRPDALSATEALELATLGAARALGLAEDVGSLDAGKQADLAVVSLEGSPYLPWEDPAAAVVFGGSPPRVLLTMVGGEVRYERGNFPWHELRQKGTEARARLLGR